MSFSLVISKDKHVAYELGLLHGTGDLSKRPPSLKWFPTTCSPSFLHYRGWKAEGQNSQSPWKWGLSIWHHFCCWDVGTSPLGGLPFPTKRQKSTRSHRVLAFPLFLVCLECRRCTLVLKAENEQWATWVLGGMSGCLPPSEKLYNGNLIFSTF